MVSKAREKGSLAGLFDSDDDDGPLFSAGFHTKISDPEPSNLIAATPGTDRSILFFSLIAGFVLHASAVARFSVSPETTRAEPWTA